MQPKYVVVAVLNQNAGSPPKPRAPSKLRGLFSAQSFSSYIEFDCFAVFCFLYMPFNTLST
ncbi:predicted protein [Botrytis cinerea T4]|uniref:Uncharacterized protein n=1 Tax=Botryotinia fuckeliana (strain T4) TaxID=999810 RepID=G2Y835_BOTF4|nr:predicted protein [Botrytis cinerea T4]